jgi:membrane-bound acyltransferase YfiQ involved in biofilm formation
MSHVIYSAVDGFTLLMTMAIRELFQNYEYTKLAVSSPDSVNHIILFLFAVAAILSLKKDQAAAGVPIGRIQTDQLKGVAIFLVIVGHLWVHVADHMAHIVLSGDGVAVFLMLSGYGLTMSWDTRQKVTLRSFFTKRLIRVMIPYWIATAMIFILDWVLLNRRLGNVEIAMTVVGLNITRSLTHLDYVRWFVTFILLWYVLFYFARRYLAPARAVCLLLMAGVPLLPLNYYVLHLEWYQFFAFPIGCAAAVYHPQIIAMYQKNRRLMLILALTTVAVILTYKASLQDENIHALIFTSVPNIVLAYFHDTVSIMLGIAALVLSLRFGETGYYSRLLAIMGRYSYELFLLHGVLLIKYNPIVASTDTPGLVGEFVLYMLFLSLFAYLLSKATGLFHAKQRV